MSDRHGSLPNHPPRAAYIHVPFCRHRCGYCNFALITDRDDLQQDYLAALERELSWLEGPFEVDTLYLGGGTPSHLAPPVFRQLLEIVLKHFSLADQGEFSMEVNPVDVNQERVDVMQAFQVNRVSLGAQSFSPRKLEILERDHDAGGIHEAVQMLRACIPAISLDLMFGVPGESVDEWTADIDQALQMAVRHVSTYGLTFEPGTPFERRRVQGELQPVSEEIDQELYELAIDRLVASGLEQYEVSSFAMPGHRSRHNETYWSGQSFFGAGPGAASYVQGKRALNTRSTVGYLRRLEAGQSPVIEEDALGAEDRARELLVLGLRRLEGVHEVQFLEQVGFSVEELVSDSLDRLVQLELLQRKEGTVRLTRKGLLVSDSIWPELL